jgi:hypothetical protein
MIRRVLTVLLAALATACASVTGFTEAPSLHQLIFVVAACVFAATLQAAVSSKKNLAMPIFLALLALLRLV